MQNFPPCPRSRPAANVKRCFAIIGVEEQTFSTGSGEPDSTNNLVQVARKLSAAIARSRHAILTGGHLARAETSVKYAALVGGRDEGQPASPTRLIGVLPTDSSIAVDPCIKVPRVDVHCVSGEPVRQLYVHFVVERRERRYHSADRRRRYSVGRADGDAARGRSGAGRWTPHGIFLIQSKCLRRL
jgi:hypothetical protein